MNPRILRWAISLVAVAVLLFLSTFRPKRSLHADPPSFPDAVRERVPHLTGSITLDGDTDDPGWRGHVLRTGAFVGPDGVTGVHPYSEARVVWGDGFLYLNLYAADEDIETGAEKAAAKGADSFHLVFTSGSTDYTFDLTPLGAVTASRSKRAPGSIPDPRWDSGIHVSHEMDGTPNKPGDNDEEWVLEVALPLVSLGLAGQPNESIALAMHRCDTPHTGGRVCGAWGEVGGHRVLVLSPP